ncbi:DUF3352 domain-containing protein [Nocardioides gansuensis]|uniref:DUF3352 domain-containing protein n=1 Tax=Nocardioides gansuensis TaxID=2138300 RepID=UPI00140383BC|nr:DUF3352 domain-containing protein [Nocardioides gansuensis]
MSSTTPSGPGGPEFLEPTGGSPVGSSSRSGDNRKRLLVLGGVVGLVAVGGAAAWAITSFVGTGAQPAEALPAGTLAYASVDLDPSGSQKIEAIRTLRKFPAFKDKINLDTDDDLRERFFEEMTSSGECEGLDYAEDVEPWLGNRLAVAGVDTGAEQPSPVVVVQISDAGAAEDGFRAIEEACGNTDEPAGIAVEGDWAIVAETQEQADKVVELAGEGTLADDDDFTRWTGETGDAGILTMYASPEIGPELLSLLEDTGVSPFGGSELGGIDPETGEFEDVEPSASPSVPPEVQKSLEDFGGAAATLRFSDGSLELEFAADSGEQAEIFADVDSGGEIVGSLPEGTIAAIGFGVPDGWVDMMAEQMASSLGQTKDELYAEASAQTGLDLPDDLEALVGDGLAVSLGEGIDPDAVMNGGPAELPIAIKIDGDEAEVEAVLEKLRPQLGEEADLLETATGDDYVVLGPNADYREKVAQEDGLEGSEAYQQVVEGADGAAAVMFVDFDADDNWLARVAQDDAELADNLEPLSALGITGWYEDRVSHGFVRLTTD